MTEVYVDLYSPATQHHRPLAGTHFTVPWRVEGWVDLGGWLHTEIKCRLRESNSDMVTHPSTNPAQRRLTSLIETNDVTTTPRRHRTRWMVCPRNTDGLTTDVKCGRLCQEVARSPTTYLPNLKWHKQRRKIKRKWLTHVHPKIAVC